MDPFPIEFHPAAVNEAAAARKWYSEINTALGEAFADELDSALQRVADTPQRWGRYFHETQCLLLRRFPYLIVYRILDGMVQVVAIQHAKRRPGYWVSRM